MASTSGTEERPSGSLSAAISNHVVRLFAEYTGRGPTRARTAIRDNVVVCITEDGMTKAERRLTQEGEAELVVNVRRKFQSTMRDDLVGGIELLTGRRVMSFLSDHNAHTDHAAEVFILDGAPRMPETPADEAGPPPAA
jgi:uncharacterized protein YbcI